MVVKVRTKISFLAGVCALAFIISGCSSNNQQPSSQGLAMPPISNAIESHDDIVLPLEMKLDKDNSMAIKTASFIGGHYRYKGRVDVASLKEFIIASMGNNKWKVMGELTHEKTMLAFAKPNKACIMTITEGFGGSLGTTFIDMSVTVDLAVAKGLNPFGEPVN